MQSVNSDKQHQRKSKKMRKNIEKLIFEEKFPTEWRKRKKVFNNKNNRAENHQNMPIYREFDSLESG